MTNIPNITVSTDRALSHVVESIDVNPDIISDFIERGTLEGTTHTDDLHIHFSALAYFSMGDNTQVKAQFREKLDPGFKHNAPELTDIVPTEQPPEIAIYIGSHILRYFDGDNDEGAQTAEMLSTSINTSVAHELEHYLQSANRTLPSHEERRELRMQQKNIILAAKLGRRFSRIAHTVGATILWRWVVEPATGVDVDIVADVAVGYAGARLWEGTKNIVRRLRGVPTSKQKIENAYKQAFELYRGQEHEVEAHDTDTDQEFIVMKLRENIRTNRDIPVFYKGGIVATKTGWAHHLRHMQIASEPKISKA